MSNILNGITEAKRSPEPNYDDPSWDEKVSNVGQKAKQAEVLKSKGKEPKTRWNPETKKYYVDFSNVDESVGLPYPGTYEETNDMFKGSSQKRIGTLTTEQGVAEGKFTHNAKTGEKLHPGTGEPTGKFMQGYGPKPVKAPAAPKLSSPKLTINDVWRKVEEVVGQIYPDGDPIDWLLPWFRKQGIADHKVGDILAKAAKKNGYKDIYDYYNSIGDDLGEGVAEAKQRLDPKCWTGKHKEGTKMKGGVRVNNCVPNESAIMKGIKV